jgi:hypothetical protein
MHQSRSTGFAPHRPEPIDSPFCGTCGNPLSLIRVERVLAGCEKHTLECPRCGGETKRSLSAHLHEARLEGFEDDVADAS